MEAKKAKNNVTEIAVEINEEEWSVYEILIEGFKEVHISDNAYSIHELVAEFTREIKESANKLMIKTSRKKSHTESFVEESTMCGDYEKEETRLQCI